jgi:hypothetical protein
VRWNYFNGGADAAVRLVGTPTDTFTTSTTNIDIYQNEVINNGGDCIEPDGGGFVNTHIYKNLLLGGNTALNWYVTRGPLYFIFNTCIHQGGAFLPRGSDAADQGLQRGYTIIANNTVTSRQSGNYAWIQTQNVTKNAYVNQICVNNILAGYLGGIYESGCRANMAPPVDTLDNEFNNNVIFATGGGTTYSKTNYSAERSQTTTVAWRDSTYGYGKNDQWAKDLQFGDSLHWDWSPKSTWTKVLPIDAATDTFPARTYPGINTNTKNHLSPAWKVNTSGSSDSTYAGAWKVNGMILEGVRVPSSTIRKHIWIRRRKGI